MSILQIPHRCPHCREKADFVVSEMSEMMDYDLSRLKPPLWEREAENGYGGRIKQSHAEIGKQAVCLSRCPHCANPIMFVLLMSNSRATALLRQGNTQHRINHLANEIRVLLTYPTVEPLTPYPAWPEAIREDFNEARRLFYENARPTFVLPQCRAVLDVIVRELGAPPKDNLKKQIDYLAGNAIITQPLAEWAHNLREDANALIHEGKQPGTREEVAEYIAFIELLLHVTYELPKAIDDKKQKASPPE